MNRRQKLAAGIILLVFGTGLIGWNLRDPDRAYREPPKQERHVTVEQVPPPVLAAVKRVSAGATIKGIKEKRQGGKTTYEVDTIQGNTKREVKLAEDGSVIKQKSKKLRVAPRKT